MFFDAEINYRFAEQAEWEAEMTRKIDRAYAKGYEQVRADGILDSSSLLGRVTLDLGPSPGGLAELPTDQRIAHARGSSKDIQLTTLVFNYGRHLLVSSSRTTNKGTSLPADLQGIWNNSTAAPWGGKYTINANTPMNYWPAGPANLIETQEPLLDLVGAAAARGRSYAARMYGCPGTVFHHNLDLWGGPGADGQLHAVDAVAGRCGMAQLARDGSLSLHGGHGLPQGGGVPLPRRRGRLLRVLLS